MHLDSSDLFQSQTCVTFTGSLCCRPSKLRPHRNEPALLPFVLERVAQARGQTPEHVARITTQNARSFFRLQLQH